MDELDLIYGSDRSIKKAYGAEPGRKLSAHLKAMAAAISLPDRERGIVAAQIPKYCRRLYMMHYAGQRAEEFEADFISGLNPESQALVWKDEVEFLYHLESMILFSRCALDIMGSVYSTFLLHPEHVSPHESFYEFTRAVTKREDESLEELKAAIHRIQHNESNWYRVMCGSERGRSLRDQVAYQSLARIEYLEEHRYQEKECCHVVIKTTDKDKSTFTRIPLIRFVDDLRHGVMGFGIKCEELLVKKFNTQGK